jgi:arsenite-transporting ATPase
MILRHSDLTRVLIVTLPETTPVLEAQALQEDLRQAGIEPFAWVINASLLAARPTDPVLRQRANAEVALVRKVRQANRLDRRVPRSRTGACRRQGDSTEARDDPARVRHAVWLQRQ